jgi:hypothetical protein
MLYTEESIGRGEIAKSRGYMEDGIMGAFFDAGHIIFNEHDEGRAEDVRAEELFGDPQAFRIARSGGAGFLLKVVMEFNSDEEEPLPQSADYRMYRLGGDELLGKGTVYLRDAGDREKLSSEELLQNMGRNLARSALSRM